MKDEKIVGLFINRNEEAIAACEDKYGKGLRTISRNILSDDETVKECENDTYFQA